MSKIGKKQKEFVGTQPKKKPSLGQPQKNRTQNATNQSIVHFLLLPGSNGALLRLLSTHILVLYRVLANYNMKLSNILYHWLLSMASFRFCETYLLHIKPFVVNKSAISPFLGGWPKRLGLVRVIPWV